VPVASERAILVAVGASSLVSGSAALVSAVSGAGTRAGMAGLVGLASSAAASIGILALRRSSAVARRAAEEMQATLAAELVRARKLAALGEVAGNIAHEINNPLAIIDGKAMQLGLLLASTPVDVPRAARFGQQIAETAQRLARLVNGLRLLSPRADSDAVTTLPVDELIRTALALCAPRAKFAGVALTPPATPPELELECCPRDVVQIVQQLVCNALDAVDGRPEPWITIDARGDGDDVVVAVADSGPGVPAAVRARLGEPFVSAKPAGKGFGLGLSIAMDLARRQGGAVALDPMAAHTCFVARLPRRRPAALPLGA
jgi:C4-dicarboxylate-specific signal transduction histidine kinase